MPYVRIPSFQSGQQVVDGQGRFTAAALRSLNDAFRQLADAINIIAQIPEIQEALLELDQATTAAQLAAENAQSAADAAGQIGDSAAMATALANSYPSDVFLTGLDSGSSATVDISDHSRVYATNPTTTVAVQGGQVTGLAYNQRYYVYYDQPSRAGGVVTYEVTTVATEIAQINNRHSVGYVDTPAPGQPDENGFPVAPPGGGYYNQQQP